MKKCTACGKLVNEYAGSCPGCAAELPHYGGPRVTTVAPSPQAPAPGAAPIANAAGGFASTHTPTPPEFAAGGRGAYIGERAGFWIRFGAYFIDNLLVQLVAIPFMVLAAAGAAGQIAQGIEPGPGSAGLTMLGYLAIVVAWGANNVYLQGTRGWTLGKRMCHIVVLNANGEVLGIGPMILREVFKGTISAIVCNLGFAWMLWDNQKQTWHDKVCGSSVYYD